MAHGHKKALLVCRVCFHPFRNFFLQRTKMRHKVNARNGNHEPMWLSLKTTQNYGKTKSKNKTFGAGPENLDETRIHHGKPFRAFLTQNKSFSNVNVFILSYANPLRLLMLIQSWAKRKGPTLLRLNMEIVGDFLENPMLRSLPMEGS